MSVMLDAQRGDVRRTDRGGSRLRGVRGQRPHLPASPPGRRGSGPAPPADGEPAPRRAHPASLSDEEKDCIVAELCSERFWDLAPAQVYTTLLDEGSYLCSERQMYRVLAERGLVRERRRGGHARHGFYAVPRLEADAPNQCWTWDITKLRRPDPRGALLLVHDHRHLLPQGRRLDDRRARVGEGRPPPDHRDLPQRRRRP